MGEGREKREKKGSRGVLACLHDEIRHEFITQCYMQNKAFRELMSLQHNQTHQHHV